MNRPDSDRLFSGGQARKRRISLIFGCHAHQPVGNFGFVFEQAYDLSYKPFLDVLERFPAVRAVLHFTGPLFDWFEGNRPEFLDRLARMSASGQIEIMGGGYYEPLLCAIPERDAVAQITRMREYCRTRFGRAPRGMWLAERVWEPQMARIMARSGVEYTALDDTHFLCSGLRPDQLYGYHMTEDEGMTVKAFPILEKLRYLVPFHPVHETIEHLRELATEDGTRCAVLHDDYEKFGVWPGTHGSVYTEGWLERFFTALTENSDWLTTTTYADFMDHSPAIGRTYLTCASYEEMMVWALPTPMQRSLNDARAGLKEHPDLYRQAAPFLRGGFWRNFLAKYDESNNIQKRMLRASNRLERLRGAHAGDPRLADAERLLHQGQCNCAYWHGVFGGLYLNHLRTALYECIIAADNVMDALESRGTDYVTVQQTDFDGDGNAECVLENSALTLFFSPTDGGTLFEADFKPKPFNVANTLTRRDEPYHDLLRRGAVQIGESAQGDLSIHEMVKAKEAGLDSYLVYDPWRRVSLRDRFLDASATPDSLWRNRAREYGDFAKGIYAAVCEEDGVTLWREGTVLGNDGPVRVRLSKHIRLAAGESAVEIRYDMACGGAWPKNIHFGVEFAANLLTGSAPDRYYRSDDTDLGHAMLGTRGCHDGLSHIAARDEWQRLECGWRFSRPARVNRFAIETVSQSEGGQERVHQGCVVVPTWSLDQDGDGAFSCTVRMEISQF
jgi:alpha-amylase